MCLVGIIMMKIMMQLVLLKNEMNEFQLGRGVSNTMSNNVYYLKAYLLQDRYSKDAANDQFNDSCHLNVPVDKTPKYIFLNIIFLKIRAAFILIVKINANFPQ